MSAVRVSKECAPEDRCYESYGSLDGRIETISLVPQPHFQLRSRGGDHLVKVYYKESQEAEILEALHHDIEVTGIVRYRDDGVPVSVRDIDSLVVYPSPDHLPLPSTFIGKLPEVAPAWSNDLDDFMLSLRQRGNVMFWNVTRQIATLASEIGSEHPALSPADCVHIATALTAGVERLWTYDGVTRPAARRSGGMTRFDRIIRGLVIEPPDRFSELLSLTQPE